MARSLALVSLALLACVREPLPEICPNVDEGTLVIAELRGPQDGEDSFGQYVEIHNAGTSTVDLQGMRIRFRFTGGEVIDLMVRESVEVSAGREVAIGPGLPESPPEWLGYVIGWDISGGDAAKDPPVFPKDLIRDSSGFVELEGCDDDLLDVVYFSGLPSEGSLACGNADSPPDAAANDDTTVPGCWCIDAGDSYPGQPLLSVGKPGTPGGANRCP